MDYTALRQALQIPSNKIVTITPATLTPNLANLFDTCYAGQPIVITNAQPGPGDNQHDTVVIQGQSMFLNVSNVPIEARFVRDSDANVQIFLKYTLLGANPGLSDWRFSTSFPQLPTVVDWNKPYVDPLTIPLDHLSLFNASYVVVSQRQQEPELHVDLVPGINFVSQMRPGGILGIVESIVGHAEPLTLSGVIRLPQPAQTTLPLKALQYPWEVTEPVPGIYLQADLRLDSALGTSNMRFDGAQYRLYTPTTSDWLHKNATYQPVLAYTGSLSIPSATIKADVVAPIAIGGSEALLLGHFQGVSVAKLASLLDIAGADDLLSHLPSQLQALGEALGKIELTQAGLDLGISGSRFDVAGVSFTLGMPELNWHVWDDHFAINSIACRFDIVSPFGDRQHRKVTLTVLGTFEIEGVPLNVFASSADGFTVYAELAEKQTIPLKQLMQTYVPAVPAPSDLTINALRVSVAPFKAYGMAIALAEEPNPWVLDLGPQRLTIRDVILSLSCPANGSVSGSFGGTIAFGDSATITARYDIPGDFMIRGEFPTVSLKQLIARLSNQALELPDAFDIHFTDSSVLIQKSGPDLTFLFGTHVEGFGSLAFEAVKRSSGGQAQWGFAAGLDFVSGKSSDLAGLSFLGKFEELFHLQKLLLVVSSFDSPDFQFPDLAVFQSPRLPTKKITLPAQSGGLVAGLNVFAEWSLDTSQQQQLLQKFLGLNPTLAITLQVSAEPAKNSRLFVGYSTTIQGHPLTCQFGGQIQDGEVGLFLRGSMTVTIQGQPQTFDVLLVFVENGAFLSATVKGHTAIDFEVFKLSHLAIEIGIDWEGIPSLGVAGTIDVATFESSIAVFFDSSDPAKSMVAGALMNLSMKDILDALTGNTVPSEIDSVLQQVNVRGTHSFTIAGDLAADLDNLKLDRVAPAFQSQGGITIPADINQVLLVRNTPGSIWYLTDLTIMRHYALTKQGDTITVILEAQFYAAPQNTMIGTLNFPMGFYVNGAIEFFTLKASATIEINPNKGLAINAAMEPFIIGSKTLFSITGNNGKDTPEISVATFAQPGESREEFKQPHFFISGQLEMLGLSRGIYLNLSKDGLQFDVHGDLIPGVNFDLHGQFDSLTNLGIGGDVKVGVGTLDFGPLGKVNLDTDVEGTLDIGVKGDDIYAKMEASFTFAGSKHEIAQFNLDVETASLAHLVSTVADKVKAMLEDFFKDGVRWAECVAKGFIEGVEDVGKVLAEFFDLIDESIWGHHGREEVVIRELLTKSQAASVDITLGTPAPAPATVEQVKAWARQLQEIAILDYVAAQQVQKPADDANVRRYLMQYANSFSITYEETQVVDWIVRPETALPPLPDFLSTYYQHVPHTQRFQVLVQSHGFDFDTLINDVTVTLGYPGLAPNSTRFTAADQTHLFSAAWDANQGATYTLQYTVTFKDGSPLLQAPAVQQADVSVTLTPPQLGIQSVTFDATALGFGTGIGQVDRVDVVVAFMSPGNDSPSQQLTLTAGHTTATAHSVLRLPVTNAYTYTITYYQAGQVVYTAPPQRSTQPRQSLYNPLVVRDVTFQGVGFDRDIRMINLTVGPHSIRLTPQQPSQTIQSVGVPGANGLTYRGTLVTSSGPQTLAETTRPMTTVIEVGDAPQWFSVQINTTLVPWEQEQIATIEIDFWPGDTGGEAAMLLVLPTSGPLYWGFLYELGSTPSYRWSATYFYKDATHKSLALRTEHSTILTLPAQPQ